MKDNMRQSRRGATSFLSGKAPNREAVTSTPPASPETPRDLEGVLLFLSTTYSHRLAGQYHRRRSVLWSAFVCAQTLGCPASKERRIDEKSETH